MAKKLLEKAIKDRYLILNENKDEIIYLPHTKVRKFSNPEEQVQAETFVKAIYTYGYPAQRVKVSDIVKMGSASKEADIMIYKDDACKDPYIVVECKKRQVSEKVFRGGVDQGFSYAAATNAQYVWTTSGDKEAFHEVWLDSIHERERNRLDSPPSFNEEKKFGYGIRQWFRKLARKPLISDTLVYMGLLVLSTLILSKLTVSYLYEIRTFTRPFWQNHGMDFSWLYNAIVLAASLLTLGFGRLFMRSHRLFRISANRRRLVFLIIALILFLPSWYLGADYDAGYFNWANYDHSWWSDSAYNSRKHPIMTYLWPYLTSVPFQAVAIYVLMWVLRWNYRREGKQDNTLK